MKILMTHLSHLHLDDRIFSTTLNETCFRRLRVEWVVALTLGQPAQSLDIITVTLSGPDVLSSSEYIIKSKCVMLGSDIIIF